VLTDSLGRKVDFKNTVVIMTSNIGTKLIQKGVSLGFQSEEPSGQHARRRDEVLAELRRSFSPEFLNRIDEMVVFHPLEKVHLISILDILLRELNMRLLEKSVTIEVDDEVKQWLIKEGYEPLYGARPMRRTIQRAIGDPLSEELIKGRFKDHRKIKVVLRDGAPAFIEQEAMAGV
jgi:ATP-dependent Clp protease ATP-binding subunit ClpC